MRATLQRDRPKVLCEVLPGFDVESQLEELLGPLGYSYYLLTPNGPVGANHVVASAEHRNQLFSTTPIG